MFTPRNIAKFAKDQIIWSVAAGATDVAIHNFVEDEPSDYQEIGIEATSLVVGYVVMHKLRSVTDKPIDAFADWRNARKNAATPVVEQV